MLHQQPQSLEQLQQAFLHDTKIGRVLSQDTVGLYMKTLKLLECKIKRPSPLNQYRYVLTNHPFSYQIKPDQLQVLRKVKDQVDGLIGFEDYFYYCSWLHKLWQYFDNKEIQQQFKKFFPELLHFDQHKLIVDAIQAEIKNGNLLKIDYEPSSRSYKQFDFLPEKLFYKRGVFYVIGSAKGYDDAVMLRIDKIKFFEVLQESDLTDILKKQSSLRYETYLIRLLNCPIEAYLPLNDDDFKTLDPDNPQHLIVKIKTDNTFLLKQHLLSSGYYFQVLYPQTFASQLIETLEGACMTLGLPEKNDLPPAVLSSKAKGYKGEPYAVSV